MTGVSKRGNTFAKPGPDPVTEYACKPVPNHVMERLEVEAKSRRPATRAKIYPYCKRLIDFVLSSIILLLSSPLLGITALVLWVKQGGGILVHIPRSGRDCIVFNEYSFNLSQRHLRKLPLLLNVLKGDISFIGPRAARPGELCKNCMREPLIRRRSTIRPGLICDWWIRRHASLDYVQEIELDALYVEAPSFRKDLSILLRAMPSLVTVLLWGDDPPEYAVRLHILGVRIDNFTMQAAIDGIMALLKKPGPYQVSFVNPHYINEAVRIPDYKQVLDDSEFVLADGFGTKLAGKILHRPIRQNLCGTDLFPRLCASLNGTGKSLFLLGAAPGAAERVAEWVQERYPELDIRGTHHGFFTPEEEEHVIAQIAESGADLLVVAMGVPRQELWIHQHLDRLGVKTAIGFGGLFDYFAGRVPRAPQWVREIGMEWVYRLIQEPRRMWRRYLIGNGLFLARVLHERVFPRAWTSENTKP